VQELTNENQVDRDAGSSTSYVPHQNAQGTGDRVSAGVVHITEDLTSHDYAPGTRTWRQQLCEASDSHTALHGAQQAPNLLPEDKPSKRPTTSHSASEISLDVLLAPQSPTSQTQNRLADVLVGNRSSTPPRKRHQPNTVSLTAHKSLIKESLVEVQEPVSPHNRTYGQSTPTENSPSFGHPAALASHLTLSPMPDTNPARLTYRHPRDQKTYLRSRPAPGQQLSPMPPSGATPVVPDSDDVHLGVVSLTALDQKAGKLSAVVGADSRMPHIDMRTDVPENVERQCHVADGTAISTHISTLVVKPENANSSALATQRDACNSHSAAVAAMQQSSPSQGSGAVAAVVADLVRPAATSASAMVPGSARSGKATRHSTATRVHRSHVSTSERGQSGGAVGTGADADAALAACTGAGCISKPRNAQSEASEGAADAVAGVATGASRPEPHSMAMGSLEDSQGAAGADGERLSRSLNTLSEGSGGAGENGGSEEEAVGPRAGRGRDRAEDGEHTSNQRLEEHPGRQYKGVSIKRSCAPLLPCDGAHGALIERLSRFVTILSHPKPSTPNSPHTVFAV
jgi:hypothetical protein